jgi:hypothetical protein
MVVPVYSALEGPEFTYDPATTRVISSNPHLQVKELSDLYKQICSFKFA